MNTPPDTLMKTCSNCGQRKPLSAFLQISGPEGSTYTNICAACRKTTLASDINREKDGTTSSDTSHTIDTKSKVKADTEKRDLNKQIEEQYFEEREENQQTQIKQIDKKEKYVRSEKEHRETYLKKNIFQDSKKPVEASKIHGGITQSREAETFNFNAPMEDTRTPKIKHGGVSFQHFISWLGKSAPIAKGMEPAAKSTDGAKQTPTQKDVTEYIDNTWGPGSKKR